MKYLIKLFFALSVCMSLSLVGCSEDEPQVPEEPTSPAESNGGYGSLNGNIITIGSTRDITYTGCVLLGTVDFPKITSDHTYGVVYMEAMTSTEFDYNNKLQYNGRSSSTDKEAYTCISVGITSSQTDGKFEKQLVGLKPNTRYYYRAYVRIGSNINYSNVESFVTKDPSSEISMTTTDPTEIKAVSGIFNGTVNIGNLQDVNSNQSYGFIYSSDPQLSTPEKLTYEYYAQWVINHFETDTPIQRPSEVITTENLNGNISYSVSNLRPGTTYYYRTFFKWNNKYFYSSEVKSLKTKGSRDITVRTDDVDEITSSSATLHASLLQFSSIGLSSLRAGFMISKVCSYASEFDMNVAVPWSSKNSYPNAAIYYFDGRISSEEFYGTITGLNPGTTYYVCAFIDLGTYYVEGQEVHEYIYGSVKRFATETDETEFLLKTSNDYPWTETAEGEYTSGNAGVDNSSSSLYIGIENGVGRTLKFDLKVSSEGQYDKVTIYLNDEQYGSDTYSGEVNRSFSIPITKRETIITITYSKDGSVNGGDDCVKVRNIRLQ